MLPGVPPRVADMVVAVRYRPADDALNVGGDWYDVVALPDRRVALAVGDVVGKGLAAATVMGQLRSALTAATYSAHGPPEAIDVLDGYARSLPGSAGTTVVQVSHDPRRRLLRYSRAGHVPPLTVTPAGRPELLFGAGAPPLGIDLAVLPRPKEEVPFPPGSTLVLYTDGLVERRGRNIDEGLGALAELVGARHDLDVDALADAILEGLMSDRRASDDAALVVARSTAD